MATYTPNLNLKKPAGTDYVLVGDFNGNADALDSAVGKLSQLETVERASLVLAINEAAKRGGENAPYIDEATGNWMMWDVATAQYLDTGVRAQGPRGETGAAAGFGAPTATAATLEPGAAATAAVEASGPDTAKSFAFTLGIPKGEKGDKGDKGDKGEKGEPGVSVTVGGTATGEPGSEASVANTGTASDPVLNFVIPRGAKGEPGVGIPAGGLPGQVLAKKTGADHEVEWANPSSSSDASITAYTVTLAAADWAEAEGGYEQAVPVATATALETCIIEAQPRDGLAAWTYDVQPVAQGAGTVTFKALHLPTADMVYGITVLNPDTVYVDTVVTAIAAHDRDAGAHANIELELTGGGV